MYKIVWDHYDTGSLRVGKSKCRIKSWPANLQAQWYSSINCWCQKSLGELAIWYDTLTQLYTHSAQWCSSINCWCGKRVWKNRPYGTIHWPNCKLTPRNDKAQSTDGAKTAWKNWPYMVRYDDPIVHSLLSFTSHHLILDTAWHSWREV